MSFLFGVGCEKSLQLVEERLSLRGDISVLDFSEFAEQCFVLGAQFPRHVDNHLDPQVAPTAPLRIGHALSLETNYFARLGSRRDRQHLLAIEIRDLDLCS